MASVCGAESVLSVVRLCAKIILENGGETYRAEETVVRICRACGFDATDVVAMPTGVFITVEKSGDTATTAVRRITRRGLNLQAVNDVNTISRRLTAGDMTLAEAMEQLEVICHRPPLPAWLLVLASGLSSGCFALLFRGSLFDFAAATVCGLLVEFIALLTHASDMVPFASSLIGGILIGVAALGITLLFRTGHLETIITGAMMPLLPGIPMTNAIRDTMRGDLVSGVARGAEALMVAAAIAFGVGVTLRVYYLLAV